MAGKIRKTTKIKRRPSARDMETAIIRPRDPVKLVEAINEVWLSTPEHEHLLPGVLDVARKFMGAHDASILMLDPSGKLLVEKVQAGKLRSNKRQVRVQAEGVTGWVAGFKEPLIIPDVREDSRYVTTDASIRSEAAIPLMVGGQLIGVLNLESKQEDYFRKQDMRMLKLLASQLCLAIQMEDLREQTRRHAENFALLFNLARLSHGVMPARPFLDRVVDVTCHSLHCQYVAVFLGDYENKQVVLLAHSTEMETDIVPGRRQGFDEGILGHAFSLGETVKINDVTQDPKYIACIEGTRSELAVPIRVGDRCLGIIDVQASTVSAFNTDDVMFFETLARFLVPTLQVLIAEKTAVEEGSRE